MTIPVEHSYVDFQQMIIRNKLNHESPANQVTEDYMFDHVQLANLMMQENSENVTFYEQDAIQKIIDYQFTTTKKFFKRLSVLYICLFLIPLFFIIFSKNPLTVRVNYIIAYFCQLVFFATELI